MGKMEKWKGRETMNSLLLSLQRHLALSQNLRGPAARVWPLHAHFRSVFDFTGLVMSRAMSMFTQRVERW